MYLLLIIRGCIRMQDMNNILSSYYKYINNIHIDIFIYYIC